MSDSWFNKHIDTLKSAWDTVARATSIGTDSKLPVVRTLVGDVYAVSTQGPANEEVRRKLHFGDSMKMNEVVETGNNGAVQILMPDTRRAHTIGPNQSLDIAKQALLDCQEHPESGRLCVAVGKVSKQTPESIEFITPNPILGVRG